MGGKKFAVLLCADDSEYMKKAYGGYFGVFVRMLGGEGEEWVLFSVTGGELPRDDEIRTYDGFVITGSCSDAHGHDSWIRDLLDLIMKLNSLKKKILGICFGHQILCRALGGKSGRAKSGWDIGLTTVRLSRASEFAASLCLPAQLRVIQVHRDEVEELPAAAEVLGTSEKTAVEVFRYGEHVLGIQGHPEYTGDILRHLIDRLLHRRLISEAYWEELKGGAGSWEPDRDHWRRLCVGFLKSGV